MSTWKPGFAAHLDSKIEALQKKLHVLEEHASEADESDEQAEFHAKLLDLTRKHLQTVKDLKTIVDDSKPVF